MQNLSQDFSLSPLGILRGPAFGLTATTFWLSAPLSSGAGRLDQKVFRIVSFLWSYPRVLVKMKYEKQELHRIRLMKQMPAALFTFQKAVEDATFPEIRLNGCIRLSER